MKNKLIKTLTELLLIGCACCKQRQFRKSNFFLDTIMFTVL